MKTGLILCTYNRKEYTEHCLKSLSRCNLKDIEFIIVDDCSTDINWLIVPQTTHTIFKNKRKGICDSLLQGYAKAWELGCEFAMNLDADSIVRNDFIEILQNLHKEFLNDIVSGFHSTTKNKDGSERHVEINRGEGWILKKSIGGINMGMREAVYNMYMKPVLENCLLHGGNFDHQVCLKIGGAITTDISVVEHIGIESAMGHNQEQPDTATGFKMLNLPDVTLVCVDDNIIRGQDAINKCTKDIEFGACLLSSPIPALRSKEAYSKYVLKELYKYIHTKYVLIVQHDGFVRNPEAWSNEFLDYDYIGATWWYRDGKNVGNGGFSLRSKKLLELCANLPTNATHPEDHIICRDMRPYLESKGIKFAPETLANQFSFEGYNQPGTYTNQFGFHGNRAFRKPPDPKKTGFIINQFLGLGDILYLVPMIRHWQSLGHDVIWPIADEYIEIKRHFPDIQFCKKSDWPRVRYEHPKEYMHQWQYGLYQVKPLRWNMTRNLSEAMTSKYTMYGLNPEMWRELFWQRDAEKERLLLEHMPPQAWGTFEPYELHFEEYGNITDGGAAKKELNIKNQLPVVKSVRQQGFTLLDMATVIENATIIHAISSSCIYLFELLNLKAKEVHLYSRKLGERDFEMVKPILTKDYILHI